MQYVACLFNFSPLWLHEPTAETISRAVKELNLPHADPNELASAYTDLFLLNVYPYGTVYTDFDGELNAPAAQQIADLFEAHNYHPPELNEVGAADHVGLCLGFFSVGQDDILRTTFWTGFQFVVSPLSANLRRIRFIARLLTHTRSSTQPPSY